MSLMTMLRYKDDKLPVEQPLPEALKIYMEQLGIFLGAVIIGLLLFILVINNSLFVLGCFTIFLLITGTQFILFRKNRHKLRLSEIELTSLHKQNDHLKAKVQTRTTALQVEIKHRKRSEGEKERLLSQAEQLTELIRRQSEQLSTSTQSLVDAQRKSQELIQTLKVQMMPQLVRLHSYLDSAQSLSISEESIQVQFRTYINQSLEISAQLIANINKITADVLQTEDQFLESNSLLALGTREREVLQLIAQGKSSSEIAELLNITAGTIRTYRLRIMHKLEASSSADLIRIAVQNGLVTLQ